MGEFTPKPRLTHLSSRECVGEINRIMCRAEAILVHAPLTQSDHCYITQSLTPVSNGLIKGRS